MMFSQSPCLDCSGRYIGCHAGCQTFSQWKADEARKQAELDKTLKTEKGFEEIQAEKRARIQRRTHSARSRGYRIK